jgi:diaminopimelate decarboxylase
MEEFRYKQNELWCEETDLKRIAEQCGTPVYVYSKRSIIDHCRHIEKAFGGIDHLSCYAVKANANKEILQVLSAEGIGADAGSIGEMQLALNAGFPAEKITFSGVGKRDDEIEFALVNNIMSLNVESAEEIEIVNTIAAKRKSKARILLRINFDIESGTHPYITTGKRHNKFGVHRADAITILKRAATLSHVEVVGIHSHIGSQITSADTFVTAAKEMNKYVEEMKHQGITIHQLNFGGGFGVQYKDYLSHPLLPPEEDHAESGLATVAILNAVLPVLKESKCKILIQPGRSLVAHAGILLTKVLYMKNTREKTFVIVDAGMNDLIRPSLYQSYHQIAPLTLSERQHKVVDVVGPLCESGDFLALDRKLPDIERSEYLAVMCAGAYGYVLSSNYNGRPRPAEVMVDGSSFEVIRKRESIQDL